MKKYTIEEIKKLKEERIILLCGKYIYDVTDYIELHPIGTSPILNNINNDNTVNYKFHSKNAKNIWKKYLIGYVKKPNLL